jgi:hypothetical protein
MELLAEPFLALDTRMSRVVDCAREATFAIFVAAAIVGSIGAGIYAHHGPTLAVVILLACSALLLAVCARRIIHRNRHKGRLKILRLLADSLAVLKPTVNELDQLVAALRGRRLMIARVLDVGDIARAIIAHEDHAASDRWAA